MKQINNHSVNHPNHLTKLAWACRRGMLELDVLLGNFLKGAYGSLSLEDKQAFTDLLSYPDPDLFAWLLGQSIPEDKELANITGMIRQYAQSRFSTETF